MIGKVAQRTYPTLGRISSRGNGLRLTGVRSQPELRVETLQRARILASDSTYPSEAICGETARLILESRGCNEEQS